MHLSDQAPRCHDPEEMFEERLLSGVPVGVNESLVVLDCDLSGKQKCHNGPVSSLRRYWRAEAAGTGAALLVRPPLPPAVAAVTMEFLEFREADAQTDWMGAGKYGGAASLKT